MPNILITGGNRGIGRELVEQYANDGWNVITTARGQATFQAGSFLSRES